MYMYMYVAASFPDLETHAWFATPNYMYFAVLAFGNNFATNPQKHTARKFEINFLARNV